jgi:hypothetical protein
MSQNQINSTSKSHIINYSSLQGKTRVESLLDRIQSANKEINLILETNDEMKIKEKKEKINITNQEEPLTTLKEKIIEDNTNNKSVQVGLDENNKNEENNKENQESQENQENQENQNQETIDNQESTNKKEEEPKNVSINKLENLDIDIPFIKKTKSILNEIKKLKEKGEIGEEEINNEIKELPKRAMVEMSLSDFKIKKKYNEIKKQMKEKNEYIKKLENEIVEQRILTNKLKKSEGEYLLKISALEDELRVMNLKLLGYNTSEHYNQHSHEKFNTDANNCGHVYGENLIHSMWVRDNLGNKQLNNFEFDNNGKPVISKGERWAAPWISQSVGNMNRMIRNVNLRNNFNDIGQFKTDHRFNYEIGEKNNFENNQRYNNLRLNDNFNGGNSNFQRVSGMILGGPNKIKLTKNFSNEFNRFRIGNNINNNF